MIITELTGGLGNQMFQYACGYVAARELQTEYCYFHHQYINETKRKYELSCFKLSGKPLESASINKILLQKQIQSYFYKFTSLQLPFMVSILQDPSFVYTSQIKSVQDNTLLSGYWQSEKYFSDFEAQIRSEFAFNKKFSHEVEKVAKNIKKTNSVAVHVRRGDYISSKSAHSCHGTLPVSYYSNAMKLMNKKIKSPVFYIFSDDISWCKSKLISGVYDIRFVEIPRSKPKDDLYLMSLCKNTITANSSFSWWGAWLNTNADKIVISPKKWFNDTTIDTTDLLPSKWIQL